MLFMVFLFEFGEFLSRIPIIPMKSRQESVQQELAAGHLGCRYRAAAIKAGLDE
jgi:hypothetical protein